MITTHPYLFRTPAARGASSTRATLPPATGFSGAPPSPSPSSRLSRYGFLIKYYNSLQRNNISYLSSQRADRHRDEVLRADHPFDFEHAAGRLPLPHHLLRHHGRLRLRRLLHLQHGVRSVCWGDCTKITNGHPVPLVYWKCNFEHVIASDQRGSGSATTGVFTYFSWVLLQPFR